MTLQAFHGDAGAKWPLPPDRVTLEMLRRGLLQVDLVTGSVYSGRTGVRMGCRNTQGYLVCTLRLDGHRCQAKIHRIVWLASGKSIPDGMVTDHINRIRDDNRIENLRLLTQAENARHRRRYLGEGNPAARLAKEAVSTIRSLHPGKSYSDLANQFGVSKSTIAAIIRGETWA